ncbi:hypothetical protein [Methylovorus glucosotrophus]|uniref:hypothetical protein n=1 Tax=Methylovorus glucosotrophus TaxID=266009 RepID=UPI00059C4B15|nr:hypothetical protein [Methylovorus glucosotrophus]
MSLALPQEHIDFLLNQPHALFVVDNIAKITPGAFLTNVSFSNTNAAGQPTVPFTVAAPTNVMYAICKEIINAIETNKAGYAEDYDSFIKS